MAKISGYAGAASLGGTTIKITGWTAEVTSEVIDTTDSGDTTWRTKLPSGWSTWTATCEGFVETADVGETVGAAAASLILTADTGITWTGNAIVVGKSTVLDVVGTDAVKVSYSFEGTGILTPANP